ncbi:hypothetical protein JCM19037_1579 [Geomicrobium sp. JCM 19037]|uniref:hypothetical protein n=1 Tax=Geomicrobium sp. JCM 19037 TaxID=1460634 RepID=UPI00045F2697|nr:hypothetical protein [Geomicrobium sp. JCM 19037]GAK03271.1 hypothetical protein JCM19037_1579 [Geomicrobium sp. JCM 19037]
MAHHYVAVRNGYAWHYADKERLDNRTVIEFLRATEGVPMGIHRLSAPGIEYDWLIAKDYWFGEFTLVTDIDEFLRKVGAT